MVFKWNKGVPPPGPEMTADLRGASLKDYFRRCKCLVVSEDNCVFMLRWDGDEWGNEGCTGRGFKLRYEVTHWAPVPEPPAEEANPEGGAS